MHSRSYLDKLQTLSVILCKKIPTYILVWSHIKSLKNKFAPRPSVRSNATMKYLITCLMFQIISVLFCQNRIETAVFHRKFRFFFPPLQLNVIETRPTKQPANATLKPFYVLNAWEKFSQSHLSASRFQVHRFHTFSTILVL